MVTAFQNGARVLRALEASSGESRRQSRELRSGLEQLDKTMQDLVQRRSDTLVELARHYLPEFNTRAIDQTFSEIRSDLQEVLNRKHRRERQLQLQWDNQLDRRQTLEVNLQEITDQLDDLVARREELESQLAEQLKQDDQFQQLSRQVLAAEEQLEQYEARVTEIDEEAEQKLPSYDHSRLFRYLYDRHYGKPQYASKGLIRKLDRWVSKLVDYPRARRGYEFLRVTPRLMAAEVERRRDDFTSLMEQVEAIEDRCADDLGLTPVLEQGDQLGQRRDATLAELEVLNGERHQIERELVALEGKQNEFYEQAIERFQLFLGSMEQSALQERTRRTSDPQDDALFDEIKWLGGQLDIARARSQSLHRDFRAWDAKAVGLADVVRRFRLAEFESRRSQFAAGFDATAHIERFLRNEINEDGLWIAIRRHQHFAPTRIEETVGGVQDVLDSELSYVLIRALAETAGAIMRNSSGREFPRRGPTRRPPRPTAPSRPRRGGFTSGRGF